MEKVPPKGDAPKRRAARVVRYRNVVPGLTSRLLCSWRLALNSTTNTFPCRFGAQRSSVTIRG